jgi:hypothetical protein
MVKIESKERWTDTGIKPSKNSLYKYEAMGKWNDWFIKCDADGYPKILNFLMDLFLRRIKRTPSAKWFQLIGIVNKDILHTINLGVKGKFIAPENGQLWVSVNDADSAYHNNFGNIDLKVEKI